MREKNAAARKLYIIITGAISAGKTTLALNLARAIPNCAYFDKDDLGPMAEKIFEVGQEQVYDRQSTFFKTHVRDIEYDVTEIMGLRGLLFDDHVIVNTPYSSEIRQEFSGKESKRLHRLQEEVHARGGELMIVYIDIDRETAKERLLKRKAEDPAAANRTPNVYRDIDSFLDTQNLGVPQNASVSDADRFFVFDARNSERSFEELKREMNIVSSASYNPDIAKERFMEAVAPSR